MYGVYDQPLTLGLRLVNGADTAQRPYSERYTPDDLLGGNAANRGTSGVDGHIPVITEDEDPLLRHLVRKVDVRLAVGFLVQIRLIDQFLVYVDVAVQVDIDPLTGSGDDPLHQYVIVIMSC